MRTAPAVFASLLGIVLALAPLPAQQPAPDRTGALRLTTRSGDTALVIRPGRIQRSATIGGVIGMLGGLAYGIATAPKCADSCGGARVDGLGTTRRLGNDLHAYGHVVLTSLIGGMSGTLVGAMVGYFGTERWGTVAVGRLRAGLIPAPGLGVGVGGSVGF